MPIDEFYLHLEGARRYFGHRRRQEFVDLAAAIAGSFSKNGIDKHLKMIGEEPE